MNRLTPKIFVAISIVWVTPLVWFAQDVFPDTIDHEYRSSIQELYDRGVVNGYPDGTFGPDRAITRAEMLKIILGAAVEDLGNERSDCFEDVQDQRYAPFVCYAKEQEIVKGYSDGTFKPDQQVTFAEGTKMALESFEADAHEAKGNRWYEPYIDFVHENNIFSKYAIFPDGTMKRGQMAYLVHQLLREREGDRDFDRRRSNKSSGCKDSPPRHAPDSVMVDGLERHFITVIPDHYDEDKDYKLIVAFHGRTNSNELIRSYYKIEREAGDDAIIIYPLWLPEEWPTRSWQNGGDRPNDLRDFKLFDALVAQFEEEYCIDQDEIYVIGHSLGGWFTNTLGCARGDVIRGIGSVGGSITRATCSGPVAAMIMHNPKDNLASFAGGLAARDYILKNNSCGPKTDEYDWPSESHCVEYTDCQDGAPVVRCEHTQDEDFRGVFYPHTRPTFAWRMIWEFWNQLR